jgi:type IV pilus assembly protein PilV
VTSANLGFTLLEVLIATLLLALGMLALNALQLRNYAQIRAVEDRSTVAWLANDLAESMRANPLRAIDANGNIRNDWSHYESTHLPDTPPQDTCGSLVGSGTPPSGGCDAAALALYDLNQFHTRLAARFPRTGDVAAAVCRSTDLSEALQLNNLHCTASGSLAIKIVWRNRPLEAQTISSAAMAASTASLASYQLRVAP